MQKLLALFSILVTTLIICAYSGKDAKYYFDEGEKKCLDKEYSKAIKDYTKAISLKPDYLSAHFKRGICRVKLDSNELAISDFTQIINVEPNGEVYYQRACAELELKDSVDACSDWKSSCELMTNRACDLFSKICR